MTMGPQRVRVLPDVGAVRKEFDYAVPDAWHDDGRAQRLAVGTMVRVELHGRRVAGWVTELDPDTPDGLSLRPVAKVSGVGPPPEIIDLARWAAARWVGPVASMLGTASPPRMVASTPRPRRARTVAGPDDAQIAAAFSGAGAVMRIAPLADRWPVVQAAVARGNALVLVPSIEQAHRAAGRLRSQGATAAVYDRDWAIGAAGATVIGTRAAAFAPVGDLAAIVMLDEHDEVYQEERSPTWHAREVVVERARRAGVPCVLVSPMPSVDAQHLLPLVVHDHADGGEAGAWPQVVVVDPRDDGSARGGLWTEAAVEVLRDADRAVVVLNRKGRSRLLACRKCDALAVCDQCDGALRQPDDDRFVCSRAGHVRPVVCAACGGTTFKNLRVGVSRAAEELEALVRERVVEITGDTPADEFSTARYFVGTEAVLHRVERADVVLFADFDQELLAPRYRSSEEALALIVRAGRMVGGRAQGRGTVMVQTRQPSHPVLEAATSADLDTWSAGEKARREILRYPPFASVAEISGEAAEAFIDRLGQPLGVQVLGTNEGSWLVRADSPALLADALAGVERPKGRMRLAVDPARL